MSPFVAGLLSQPEAGIQAHPHYRRDARTLHGGRHPKPSLDFPDDWWVDIGAIGTLDDVVTHIEALTDAGADDVSLFPGPTLDLARDSLQSVIKIHQALAV